MEELNQKLDICASEIIECYQEILSERVILEKFLTDGFLNMSKARSIMGCSSLSQLQIPQNEMETQIRVNEYYEEKNNVKTVRFDMENTNKNSTTPKWIAPFSPLSLKNSQKDFTRSLNIIVSVAEKQIRLEALRNTYRDLLKNKANYVGKKVEE